MQVSKETLYASFASGEFPTGNDFQNLIDSCFNDGLSANTAQINTLSAETLQVNEEVGINSVITLSLFPSGSAQLTFTGGLLTQVLSGA